MQKIRSFFTVQHLRTIIGGVALLVIGGILGIAITGHVPAIAGFNTTNLGQATPAPGSTNNISKYCTTYLQNLANALGKSQQEILNANQTALKAAIQQAVSDGKLTQSQADTIEQQLSSASNGDICANISKLAGGKFGGALNQVGAQLKNVHSAVIAAVAQKLGVSTDTLTSTLNNGTSIVDFAKSKGVDQTTLNNTIISAVQTQLDSLVKAGTLTQSQETEAMTLIKNSVNNGNYGLLGLGKMGGRGMGIGAGMHRPSGQQPNSQ
jgi:lambda repressor-like predicted transcriptional regulator